MIRALDVGRLAAPDRAGGLSAPEQVLLVVGRAEDVVSNETEQQDGQGVSVGELDRVVDQVQTLESKNNSYNVLMSSL